MSSGSAANANRRAPGKKCSPSLLSCACGRVAPATSCDDASRFLSGSRNLVRCRLWRERRPDWSGAFIKVSFGSRGHMRRTHVLLRELHGGRRTGASHGDPRYILGLEHLGYLAGPRETLPEATAIAALKRFQSDSGLPASGGTDPATIAALEAAHGS